MELFVIWQKVSFGWWVGLVLLSFKIFLCGRLFYFFLCQLVGCLLSVGVVQLSACLLPTNLNGKHNQMSNHRRGTEQLSPSQLLILSLLTDGKDNPCRFFPALPGLTFYGVQRQRQLRCLLFHSQSKFFIT